MRLAMSIFTAVFLVLVLSAYAEETPGKAVFDQSCKNCHGVEGKGDKMADSFWKVRIPRLNSKYVQGKSDEELTRIITGGIRKMEPVKVGAPADPHRPKITPQQVEDVIRYVRTLKQ
jgi:mono/diheme cytochrome c family protein